MRWVAAWIVLAGCRLHFDELADANGDAADVGYFMSPTGDDANPGTRALPWRTFTASIPKLVAGDTLNLLDGEYDANALGRLDVQCGIGAANGTPLAPITVRADHSRRAHLFGKSGPVEIQYCSYWSVAGLYVTDLDDPTAVTIGGPVTVYNSDHIIVRDFVIVGANRYQNVNALEIGHSADCLVEDAEAYEFFRGAFTSFDSHRTTFRRLYANGRGVQDLSGGYVSTCPGGDYGIEAFSTGETLVEDCIVENICNTGFTNLTAPSVTGDTGIGDDSRFIADIALGPGAGGFEIYSVCDATSPCDTPDRIASRNQIIESAAFNFDTDFAAFGEESVLRNVSAIDATNNGFYFDVRTPPGGLVASVSLTAGLVVGTTIGVLEANQATWSVDYTNVWSAGTAFSPNDSHVTNASMIDPQIGICNVYLAPGSPMRGAGPNGTNIGADIRVQYRDGVATTDPYWRANGVFAGCGGVIAGLNDDPSTSCIGVHTRLHVGTAGCAWP